MRISDWSADVCSSDLILDLSKVEAGRYELHEGEVAPGDVLSRCAGLLRERADQRQLTLTCGDSDIRLHADARALKQVVFNLLSNAIKFTDPGGAIAVAATLGKEIGRAHVCTPVTNAHLV